MLAQTLICARRTAHFGRLSAHPISHKFTDSGKHRRPKSPGNFAQTDSWTDETPNRERMNAQPRKDQLHDSPDPLGSHVRRPIGTVGISRRDLLKGTGGFVLTTGLIGLPVVASAATRTTVRTNSQPGGTLRVGVVGSANDIIDGQKSLAKPDQARLIAGFETLLTFDETFAPTTRYGLAQSVTQKSLSKYVIRLKPSITFHNKSPLNAESVKYSLQRLVNKQLALPSLKALVDFLPATDAGYRKIDDLTLEVTLLRPLVGFQSVLATYSNAMVPLGYKTGGSGTGPYMLQSFTPGRESIHVRNPNYRTKGKPTFDQIKIIDYTDKTSLTKALRSGQVDCAVDIALSDVAPLKATPGIKINEVVGGAWLCICMDATKAPFDNPKVRQALRLIIDRKQILDRALQGHGVVANDLFGYVDPHFNANKFPQRTQNIPKALALLKQAGFSAEKPLEFELPAPNDTGGLIPLAQAFAQHCKLTNGVVKVTAKSMDSTYWDTAYVNTPIYTSFWSPRPYLAQIGATQGYTECRYEQANPVYQALYLKAVSEPDETKRVALIKQLQKLDYNEGAYIIPVFNAFADAYNERLHGIVQRPSQLNLDSFGRGFQELSFK
jgi:peptide/nickel transport system substrate-binding protein